MVGKKQEPEAIAAADAQPLSKDEGWTPELHEAALKTIVKVKMLKTIVLSHGKDGLKSYAEGETVEVNALVAKQIIESGHAEPAA